MDVNRDNQQHKKHVVPVVIMTLVVFVVSLLSANGTYGTWRGCDDRNIEDSCFDYRYREEDKTSFGSSMIFGILTVAAWTGVSVWFGRGWLAILVLVWLVAIFGGIDTGNWGSAASAVNMITFAIGGIVLLIGAAFKCFNAHPKW